MIEVVIGKSSLEIKGHAKDKIVCAAVSTATEMVGSYLEKKHKAIMKQDDGYFLIYDMITNERNETCIMLCEFLKMLKEDYPDEILIKHTYENA